MDILSKLIWDGIAPGLIHDSINPAKYKMMSEMISSHQAKVVCIGPIISIKNFYVETELSSEINKNIRTIIDNKKNWISVLYPKNGEIIIAKNTLDNKLYRAKVLMQYEDCKVYKCFLIDCGTLIDCTEFFEPCEFLRNAPPVKIHCCLNTFDKTKDSLLESITLSFIDELALCSNDLKIMDIIEIGSPCIVDLEIRRLKMSKILKPREVTVIDIRNINAFKVRLNTTGMQKINDVLKCVKKLKIVSNPQIFELYIAKIGEYNKRVKFMDSHNSGFVVMLVDEKNNNIIVNELFQLPKSIKNVKTTDIYCSLGLNRQEYSEKKFIDISDNSKTKFLMVVIKHDNINGHIVKLFLKYKDVTTMICK